MSSLHRDLEPVAELPLKLLVLAELTPPWPSIGMSPGEPHRIRLDKDNFHEVLEQLGGRLILELPNRLSEMPHSLTVEIVLKNLTSFRPEAIAEQIPSIKGLLEIRELLVQVRDGKLPHQDLLQRLSQSHGHPEVLMRLRTVFEQPPRTPPSAPLPSAASGRSLVEPPRADDTQGALEALLDMVELPEAAGQPASRRAESLIDGVISAMTPAGSSVEPAHGQVLTVAIADLDAVISAQLDEIVHHPEFRRLESSWRGLKFLVDRTDFRANIQLEVLNLAKASLHETFHEAVLKPEDESTSEVPVSVIIAAYEFDRSADDMALLQELSRQLEMLQVPLLASVGPAFLGLASGEAPNRLPYAGEYFQRPEYIKWNAFRDSDASRWVTLALNRFLLRLPYGPGGEPVKTFDFRESVSHGSNSYLWGNPIWALACLVTASFARTGWPTEITGIRGGGVVTNLPVRAYEAGSGDTLMLPLETLIPDQLHGDLADNGLLALTGRTNSDIAIILSAPTAHRPERYADTAATADSALRATLPYQLAASRIAHHVRNLYGAIVPGNTPDGIRSDFAGALRHWLSESGERSLEAATVEVSANEEHPEYHELILHVHPGAKVLGGRAAVELRLQIRL